MNLVAILALVTIGLTASQAASPLKVTVYYESLCPDSKRFITTQLYPAYQQIGEYLDVQFVPFGKASVTNTTDGLEFTCQHGPNECYGNEMHACAMAVDSDEPVEVEFVNCAMASDDASDDANLEKCADDDGVSWTGIEDCMETGMGAQLFVENGLRTAILTPALSYVPTIVFNGVYDAGLQDSGEHDFLNTACELLDQEPSACSMK